MIFYAKQKYNCGTRAAFFKKTKGHKTMKLADLVNVHLSSGEGGCRFEQIGEKTVPILKIVCDDGGGEP